MITWGVDCDSFQISIVVLKDGAFKQYVQLKCDKKMEWADRCYMNISKLGELLDVSDTPDLVAIEAPIMVRNPKVLIQLSSIDALVWYTLTRRGINWKHVSVTEWKKEIIGKGNADKDTIKSYVQTQYGIIEDSGFPQHFYDAYCISKWLCRTYGTGNKTS